MVVKAVTAPVLNDGIVVHQLGPETKISEEGTTLATQHTVLVPVEKDAPLG